MIRQLQWYNTYGGDVFYKVAICCRKYAPFSFFLSSSRSSLFQFFCRMSCVTCNSLEKLVPFLAFWDVICRSWRHVFLPNDLSFDVWHHIYPGQWEVVLSGYTSYLAEWYIYRLEFQELAADFSRHKMVYHGWCRPYLLPRPLFAMKVQCVLIVYAGMESFVQYTLQMSQN